jgi:hypothetical protein
MLQLTEEQIRPAWTQNSRGSWQSPDDQIDFSDVPRQYRHCRMSSRSLPRDIENTPSAPYGGDVDEEGAPGVDGDVGRVNVEHAALQKV